MWKFTGCSSVHGGDPARRWSWDRSGFVVLSYGWEELILQVFFRHCLQVGDSNLLYNCCVFFDFAEISVVLFWGCYNMVSEHKAQSWDMKVHHLLSLVRGEM